MGRQLVERRLKTLRRLFHPLPAEVWSMLKNSDAYFPFFRQRAQRGNFLYYHRFRRQKLADALKNERFTLFFFTNASPALIASRPRIVERRFKTLRR